MIFAGSYWLLAPVFFNMISQVYGYPEQTITNEDINTKVPVIWNTHQSPYVNLTGVLSSGNESLIVHARSQLDLWRLEGDGYVLQKSCQLEKDMYHLAVFPNSSIVWYINKNDTLILYDITSCRPLLLKDIGHFGIYESKTTKDHVLIQTYNDNAKLFNWNGTHLKRVVTFPPNCREIQLSPNGVVVYRKGFYGEERQQLRFLNTTSRRSIKISTGFEFGSYLLSPDGRYAVLSSEGEDNVAVYDTATNRLVFNGSAEIFGSVRRVLLDDDRLYILFTTGHREITDITIAYIDFSASIENPNSRNMTFTTTDLEGSSVFADQFDFRRINGSSYLQVVSKQGQLNFFKLSSDGETWSTLQ